MTEAKTSSQRVEVLRENRRKLGLRRLEVYAHPDDWAVIKALADQIAQLRAEVAAERTRCTLTTALSGAARYAGATPLEQRG